MKKTIRIVLIVVAALGLLGAAVYAAETAAAGTEDDPLVTLSYIEEVFTAQVTELFHTSLDEKEAALRGDLEERVAALEEASAEAEALAGFSYEVVTLYDGETVVAQRGTEIILRIGDAVAAGEDSPALVDTSSTGSLDAGGSLEKNHLYMVTISGCGLRAVGTVRAVIRGDYTVS